MMCVTHSHSTVTLSELYQGLASCNSFKFRTGTWNSVDVKLAEIESDLISAQLSRIVNSLVVC